MAITLQDLQKSAATVVTVSGTDAFYTGRCRLLGMTLTSGTDAASLAVYDAVATSGSALVTIKAAAAASHTVWFGPGGVRCATGIHGNHPAGTSPAGYLYYVAE